MKTPIGRLVRISTWVLLLSLNSVVVTGCASIAVGSHYDETANFTAYRTFTWVGDDPYVYADSSMQISPLTQQKLREAIRRELTSAGFVYREPAEPADMLVAYTVGTRDAIRVDSYPVDYPGRWGWHVHDSYFSVREVREHTYTKGTLGVDIFDGETNKPVWHGWAEKTITDDDRRNPDATIDEGTAKLFANFPR